MARMAKTVTNLTYKYCWTSLTYKGRLNVCLSWSIIVLNEPLIIRLGPIWQKYSLKNGRKEKYTFHKFYQDYRQKRIG